MSGEAINLANTLLRVQFAQDAYAIFQAVDQAGREELSIRQKNRALHAQAQVEEAQHTEGKTVIAVDKDGSHGQNFDESLDQARKRLKEHKQAEETENFSTPEDGSDIDVIV